MKVKLFHQLSAECIALSANAGCLMVCRAPTEHCEMERGLRSRKEPSAHRSFRIEAGLPRLCAYQVLCLCIGHWSPDWGCRVIDRFWVVLWGDNSMTLTAVRDPCFCTPPTLYCFRAESEPLSRVEPRFRSRDARSSHASNEMLNVLAAVVSLCISDLRKHWHPPPCHRGGHCEAP